MLHLTNANDDKNSSVSKINLDVYQRGGWKVENTCLLTQNFAENHICCQPFLSDSYVKSGSLHLLNVKMLWFSANSTHSPQAAGVFAPEFFVSLRN